MPIGKYRLLAVDVDGTLMHDGVLDEADTDALRAAAEAGIAVCLCTGRSWAGVKGVWESLRLPAPHAPVICAGGSLVVEPDTGRTLYSRTFERAEAQELAEQMRRMGYPVMALVDAWREGFDYYLIGQYEDHPLYRNFFDNMNCRIRRVDRLDNPIYPCPLRLSVLEKPGSAGPVVRSLREHFTGRIEVHHIYLAHRDVDIIEAFSAGTDKFTALKYVGQGYRIGPAAMAAVGDDNNDLVMLRGAALGGAPADASDELRRAADIVLAPRGAGPVAQFVAAILDGGNKQCPPASTGKSSRSSSAGASGSHPEP